MPHEVQMNVRISRDLASEIDELVRRKKFRSKKEAVEEAIRMLIAREKIKEIDSLIEEIRKGTEHLPGVTRQLLKDREEEDVLHSDSP